MFTGIVEETGTLEFLRQGSATCVLGIRATKVLEGTQLGDSIAVNGVCLTVTSMTAASFTADVMPETLRRSSLGQLAPGATVNLERAMPMNGRFGGHIVSGHIDGCGTIIAERTEVNAVWLKISAEPAILRYVIEKGSITIDGISLTVATVQPASFEVSLIPHTRAQTNLQHKHVGATVNLECDVIAKYVEKFTTQSNGITADFLAANGF